MLVGGAPRRVGNRWARPAIKGGPKTTLIQNKLLNYHFRLPIRLCDILPQRGPRGASCGRGHNGALPYYLESEYIYSVKKL